MNEKYVQYVQYQCTMEVIVQKWLRVVVGMRVEQNQSYDNGMECKEVQRLLYKPVSHASMNWDTVSVPGSCKVGTSYLQWGIISISVCVRERAC